MTSITYPELFLQTTSYLTIKNSLILLHCNSRLYSFKNILRLYPSYLYPYSLVKNHHSYNQLKKIYYNYPSLENLPLHITYLVFSQDFNEKIIYPLPETIIHLEFSYKYDYCLENVLPTMNLNKLILGKFYSFYHNPMHRIYDGINLNGAIFREGLPGENIVKKFDSTRFVDNSHGKEFRELKTLFN